MNDRASAVIDAPPRVLVAISGASGAVYGVRLLQRLQVLPGVATHLVVSDAGWTSLRHETGCDLAALHAMANQVHDVRDIGAVVFALRKLLWLPDFSIERYAARLATLHDQIRREGAVVTQATRYLIEAVKPDAGP